MIRMKVSAVALAACALLSPMAEAATLFDGSGLTGSQLSRSGDSAPLARFILDADMTLEQIGVMVSTASIVTLKFVVFEGNNLVWSDISTGITTSGLEEVLSPVLSLTLSAGTFYSIGAIADAIPSSGLINYAFDTSASPQNGVNPAVNINAGPFASPSVANPGSAYIAVSLYGPGAAVPLPASAPALLAGLGALAMLRRRARA